MDLSTASREAMPHRSDFVPESRLAGANEIIGGYSNMPPEVPGFTLDDAIEVIRRGRLILLVSLVIGILIAILLLSIITPLYAVSARVVVAQQEPWQLTTDSGSATFIATQAEVISSPRIVRAAVATLPRPDHLAFNDDAVVDALDAVHASAILGTRVIALGYLGADARYGAALLTAMVDAYVAELRDTTRTGQAKSLETKAAELEGLLEDIEQNESRIKELRRVNGIVSTADEAAAAQAKQLDEHAAVLAKVRNRRIELESRLATGGAGLNADDPVTRALRQDLRQAKSELSKVRESLTWEHPAVVAAERDVRVLRAQLASSVDASLDVLKQQINEAAQLETELAAIEAQSRARLEAIELHRRDENKLLKDLVRMRALADGWRRQFSEQRLVSRLAQTGDVGIGARIIAEPLIPEQPVWPKPIIMLVAGAFFGLIAGFVYALIALRRRREPGMAEP